MHLNEKSRVAIPAYTLAGLLLTWLLWLTNTVAGMKTDVAVIKATVVHSSPVSDDSAMAKNIH